MNVKDVVREYLRAAFKTETIVQAWAKPGVDKDPTTGGAKCNPGHFTAVDFAPSSSTSTQLQLPDGYPARPASPSSSSSSESGSYDKSTSSNEEGDDWHDVTSVYPPRHRATIPSSSATAVPVAPQSNSASAPLQPLPAFTNVYDDSDSDSDDDPPSHLPTPAKIAHYRARNMKLKEQRTHARRQRDKAATHAILAGEHVKTLKGQLNAKKSTAHGTAGRIVHMQSRIVTTAEGRAAAQAQKEAREAKATERQNKKDDAAAASHEFAGTFKQQKLGELQDLAWALGLDEKGTKGSLLGRIQAHFDLPANAALCKDSRFVALFGKRKRGEESSDEEPVAGLSTTSSQRSPQRRRLDEVGNFVSSPRRPQPDPPRPAASAQATVHPPAYYPFPPLLLTSAPNLDIRILFLRICSPFPRHSFIHTLPHRNEFLRTVLFHDILTNCYPVALTRVFLAIFDSIVQWKAMFRRKSMKRVRE
ncbi:hypothetical protein DFH07DRAFT_991749 [Mycena maculata]|uniref:SAP domain-containing protein n=1 Tax=Mycena maculata TaxID=230809 RepID=A0AAD7I0Y8_9AGAR|nr:hypothetical protein DFH07DRAFT_991749 [Mycena maculata]